jgi:hypothetical protein
VQTRFIPAYDTEKAGDCLRACRTIVEVHQRFNVPATFFIVGKRLEDEGSEYRSLLGDCSLFEIASHTYSHRILREHPWGPPAVGGAERIRELTLGKDTVEQVFGRPCLGIRPGYSFVDGLHGDPELVDAVASAGLRYVSSTAWGPDYSLPAPLAGPTTYESEGHPDLWELPAHGWHENVLKGYTFADGPRRLILWPMSFPGAIPIGPIQTPDEEFAINRQFIDGAVSLGLSYVSLIWHPWSLGQFDSSMRMLALTFQYVRDIGMDFATYADEWSRRAEDGG